MSDVMEFANREEFRKWLCEHCLLDAGREKRIVWMVNRLNQNLKPI